MPALNRPLTKEEVEALWRAPLPMPAPFDFSEPMYFHVNYSSRTGRSVYTTPDEFYWGPKDGPSDCVWMVPGMIRRRS